MIEQVAWLYVNVLEPMVLVLGVLLGVVLVLSIANFIRDPKAKENLIKSIVTGIFKFFKILLVSIGKTVQISIKLLLNVIKVIFAAIRDFFSSKI